VESDPVLVAISVVISLLLFLLTRFEKLIRKVARLETKFEWLEARITRIEQLLFNMNNAVVKAVSLNPSHEKREGGESRE